VNVDYGYEIVTQTDTLTENVEATVTATCPTGKVVVGGGWLSVYPADHVAIAESYPTGTGWAVRVKLLGNTGGSYSTDVTAYAVCIDAN
jgi:hypothetical protein